MKIRSLLLPVAAVAVLAAAPSISARAQQTDPVIARVDGVELRQSDLALAEADIGANLPPSDEQKRRETLLTYLIDVTLVARAAEKQKLAEGPDFERKVAYVRKKVLMEALLDGTKNAASEAAMKKLYDESVAKITPEKEVRASHILVESEDKAKEIAQKLKAGGDFAALAKENSKDPGASGGGDLGYFSKSQMVPEFAEAAFRMQKGQISDPVKTQFGWHIIKVEDARDKPPPPYDEVKDQISNFLVQRAQAELVTKLRSDAKIERVPPPASATPPAQTPPAQKK
jgi:peptidyl-prolyl cis-trans isomerase C